MSSLIDPLTECWIVNNTSLSDSDSVISVAYLALRHETRRMPFMSTLFYDTVLVGLEVPDLAHPIIGSGSQPYDVMRGISYVFLLKQIPSQGHSD